jgi:hypothetical protein
MSVLVEEYVEVFEMFRSRREDQADHAPFHPALEEVYEADLLRIWNEMTVEECEEIYRRYPELRIRRYG